MSDDAENNQHPLDSKSAEILQNFVDNLLSVPDSSVSFENIEKPIIEKNTPAPLNAVTYAASSSQVKPLLSERLKLAQNLLKDMPKITDVEPEQVKVTQIKDVPEILSKPVLPTLTEVKDDDIVIVSEPEQITESRKEQVFTPEIVPESKPASISAKEQKKTELKQQQQLQKSINKRIKTFKGAPEWGKGEFQTLTFNIGELKLAVPLIKLGGIHRFQDEPTQIAGRPPWYLGLMPDDFGNISLIDTARWIMPDQYEIAKAKGLDYEYVVLLDNTRWGLACSSVDDAITLTEDDVKWSAKGSKRPWLAGMLVDKMCALLDVDVLINMLEDLAGEPSRAN